MIEEITITLRSIGNGECKIVSHSSDLLNFSDKELCNVREIIEEFTAYTYCPRILYIASLEGMLKEIVGEDVMVFPIGVSKMDIQLNPEGEYKFLLVAEA